MRSSPSTTIHRDRGFSLVELLIVIVILGILATVTVFAVRGIVDRGEVSSCQADERRVETAVEAYFAKKGGDVIRTSDPVVAGVSGIDAEATLTEVGLLTTASDLHHVDTDGAVTVQSGSRC